MNVNLIADYLPPQYAEADQLEASEERLLEQWEARLRLARQIVWRERLALAQCETRLASAEELLLDIADTVATVRCLIHYRNP